MNQGEKNQSSENEHFYRELDEKKSHGSCCTCQTFAIFFIVLFLVLGGITFFLYWEITHGGILAGGPSSNLTAKTTQDKITNLKPNTFGEFSLVLSSEDMTNLLSEGFSKEKLVMKDIYVSINPNDIIVYSTLTQPISSKMAIEVVPKVENGKVNFQVQKISAGKLSVPLFLIPSISKSLSNLVSSKLDGIYTNFEVTKINLTENKMEIDGKIKGR